MCREAGPSLLVIRRIENTAEKRIGKQVVEEANRVWLSRTPDKADYLKSARLLAEVLEQEKYTSPEERMHLAVMTAQFRGVK